MTNTTDSQTGDAGRSTHVSKSTSGYYDLIWRTCGEVGGISFGTVIVAVPDLDHDGVGEIAVGSPVASVNAPGAPREAVYVLSGSDGSIVRRIDEPFGDPGMWRFGGDLALIRDLDGDSTADLAVASGQSLRDGEQAGIWLISVRRGVVLRRLDADSRGEEVGLRISSWSLLDRPTFDLATTITTTDRTSVRAWDLVDATQDSIALSASDPSACTHVLATGDLDSDGICDVVAAIGSRTDKQPASVERFRLIAVSGADGRILHESLPADPWCKHGETTALVACSDLDSDGVADLLWAYSIITSGGVCLGRLDVISAKSGLRLNAIESGRLDRSFGRAIAAFAIANNGLAKTVLAIGSTGRGGHPGAVELFDATTLNCLGTVQPKDVSPLFGNAICTVARRDAKRTGWLVIGDGGYSESGRDVKGTVWCVDVNQIVFQ